MCIHLKGNLCEIYDHRPLICSVDKMYETYFCSFYSREEYDKLNMDACQKLKSE